MKKLFTMLLSILLVIALVSGCGKTATESKPKIQYVYDDKIANVSYVMIYNPDIYDEEKSINKELNTGDFADSVEAITSRAGELTTIPEIIPISVGEANADFDPTQFDLAGGRGGSFITPYSVGDTHDFYCGNPDVGRTLKTFVCRYAGEDCNIWTYDNSASDDDILTLGKEFDSKIYDSVVDEFGESRFYANGGKVNLLVYPMGDHLGGYFYLADLFASDESTPEIRAEYTANADHDIININSACFVNDTLLFSTAAHEFQHLVCFTSYFETGSDSFIKTWLNEAMSGYIEEKLYPGTKEIEGHFKAFTESASIRHGQSLYNFETIQTNSVFDIGVYGSVYLYSEYLSTLAGDSIFSDIHSYWRKSYSRNLNEAEAITNSFDEKAKNEINDKYNFEGITFADTDDEFLSKLTLDFYLSLLNMDDSDPEAFKKVEAQTLLYDEINPADIEGGGRVIAALKENEFVFPEDADEGLIYIGLDENFNVVTECVIR